MSEYGRESMWRDTATAGPERARDLAARLERRAKAVDEIAARDAYLDLLDIATGEHVLDVGCGSGALGDGSKEGTRSGARPLAGHRPAAPCSGRLAERRLTGRPSRPTL